ncbi:MAG: hypothetical protein CUN56_11675, partial [Phototrophicales bacterium]
MYEDDPEKTIKSSPVPEAPKQLESDDNASVPTRQLAYFPRQSSPPPPPNMMQESAARARARRRRNKRSGSEWAWVIVAGAILSLVGLVGMSIILLLTAANSEPKIIPTATLDLAALPPAIDYRDQTGNSNLVNGEVITLDNGMDIVLTPWDGESRFTILMMGMDRRPGETGLGHLTDTMILVSIDPRTNTVGVLSIPRDLYVPVPGYSQLQRINTAMVLGEIRQPGLGPQLAMQTVQSNLGIRVHEYIVVDFQAVIDIIDAIGGIEVTTDYTINDPYYPDMYYGYDPFYLPAGTHTLDGATALKYARTRHGDSDIQRAGRQQEVIFAIRDKILKLDMLPQLIIRAPSLLASLSDNVYTGLDLTEMIELAWFLKDVPAENIRTGVISFEYLQDYTTPDGSQVLIPNRYQL